MSDNKKQQTYYEAGKQWYNQQYESWVPWLEDKFLGWKGENKTSYVAKGKTILITRFQRKTTFWVLQSSVESFLADGNRVGELDKTKITGDKNIDSIQDGVNGAVTGQFKKGGALEGVGNLASKEVFTRSERQGKNEQGKYGL
jgi:hypothetical protein